MRVLLVKAEPLLPEIPATGRSVTLKLCDVLQFSDGKLVSQRTYLDTGSLMTQLGHTAGQTATTRP